MSTAETLSDLRRRIQAGYPVLLLRTFEEQRWEQELAELAGELDRGLVTWSLTSGPLPPLDHQPAGVGGGAIEFLDQIVQYPGDHLFLLKDLHPQLASAEVCRKLRDVIPTLAEQCKTILLMSPVETLPVELVKDVTVVDLPIPGPDEMRSQLLEVLSSRSGGVEISPRDRDRLVQAVLGLTLREARNAFANVLQGEERDIDDVFTRLVAEKRRLIQGSNLLEFFDLDEGLDDIGGLDGLKDWLQQRANAFNVDANARGITFPRGVLLAGVQGCGKSLSARATARILGFPLVRLELGTLLESTRGGSEQNLRDVLRLMETIAPAVLWLEEIDKAFAGFTQESHADATVSRIIGRFLTWLQEHTAPVFVVATANNVSSLPPELLRRGRFDDLFFVDLPNYHERIEIFRIHLAKRNWKPEKFDLEELSSQTDGFNGAEIEQAINSAIIESFAQGRMPTQADLMLAREQTVPLSVTMADEIFRLREWARTRCRPATLDHRVIQVLEEEQRRGELQVETAQSPQWVQLAEHGQLAAAVVEYIRLNDHVLWPQLLEDFAPFVPTSGEFGIVLRSDPKIAIWLRLSRELAEVFCDYIDGKRLYLHPVSTNEVKEADRPHLPSLETLPQRRLNKPVWFPTKIRLLPPQGGSGPLGHVSRVRMGRGA